jgi:hypothetical protein
MWLHHQPRTFLMEPPAAVSATNFDKVDRPVVLGGPITIIDLAY